MLPVNQPVDPTDPISETVLESFKSKHPPPGSIAADALLSPGLEVSDHHPVLFDQITGSTIRSAALRCSGSAGPSGLDAPAWQRLSTAFKGSSTEVCEALALVARQLCTVYVAPSALSAFTACRLIALDKCPGVRPIGVAEVTRRIVGNHSLTCWP